MAMKGFDPKFDDIPDYILGITEEIWEDRGVDTLRHYYAPKIAVRSPSGITIGNESVITSTLATLEEFPDRQLLGEDVIWSGNADDGYLSSHRILSTATHTGHGVYGAATGVKLTYRVIADCAARANQIYDEWLIRDQGAIVLQLGADPKTYAAQQIEAQGGIESAIRPFTPDQEVGPAYTGVGNDNAYGERYSELLRRIMGGDIESVGQTYDRAVHLELPSGRSAHGWSAAEGFWTGLRSALPNAVFEVHHQIGQEDIAMPPRAALRWTLHGTHDGAGPFGSPSGADVYVMGLSHAEFGPRGLRREWVLFDETAIWKQILLHTG